MITTTHPTDLSDEPNHPRTGGEVEEAMTTTTTTTTRATSRANRPARTHVTRALVLAVLAALSTLGLAGLASPAHADAGSGWVRLAHLSPDTPSVNVALTSLSDSKAMLKLKDVGYGDVSGYTKVPAGTYVASMTPAGGDAQSTPAISQPVKVENGKAYTVAAIGRNADLTGTVLTDDLTPAKAGDAKVRLLQASVSAPKVTVTADGGPTIARDAAFASSTGYAQIDAGVWSVTITPTEGTAQAVTTDVTVTSASVNTIIVLDGKNGGITAIAIKDAGGVPKAKTPKKGVNTGGGGTATDVITEATATGTVGAGFAGAVLAAVLGLGALLVIRNRRPVAIRATDQGRPTG